MWKSRGNLQGYQFNAVIGHWKPFAYNLINDTNSNIIKAEGFVLDVMNYLKKHLNFTLNLTFKERWTDIVEMVHKKQVDLAATGFSQTFKRSSLVDFSFPLTSISLRFVYRYSVKNDVARISKFVFGLKNWDFSPFLIFSFK